MKGQSNWLLSAGLKKNGYQQAHEKERQKFCSHNRYNG
jgi:hypothetical protein